MAAKASVTKRHVSLAGRRTGKLFPESRAALIGIPGCMALCLQ
jgi:hypothetical protein